ncbi:MAG: hypothetical protein IJN91_02905 [Alphaproteobacteria bacterium]|nr:hypothetical protein [Alphaproteobacteria bacterium]
MRKIIFALIGCFAVFCAHAAQVVNVDYVHKLIAQKWDISVPIKTNNIMAVANMKYLLTAIDVANEILNGEPTTDYGNTEFATTQVADTVATIQAVDTLIQKPIEYKFFLTTTRTNSFSFSISAAGKFYIDWGDGKRQTITKPDTTNTTYTHNYDTVNTYTIGLSGQATAYNTRSSTATISFYVNYSDTQSKKIASIDGSLGAIFGTLSSDTNNQPRFYQTFYNATNMKGSIPENLFGNISGTAKYYMFYQTFYNCTSLTGPSARINGQYLYEIWPDTNGASDMYFNATGLSDYLYIPVAWGGLGATTNEYPSAPSDAVYDFYLTTTSNTDMFAMQISAAGEFYIDWGDGKSEWVTKSDTTNMTFGHKYASKGVYNIRLGGQATAYNTSTNTAAISFYIGPSSGVPWKLIQTKIASIDGSLGAIFGTLADETQPRFYETFYGAHNMTGAIPENLFSGISGAPASYMFYSTFYDCNGLTSIPSDLFAGISGNPASYMFDSTFYGCSGLTSIPSDLFAGISGNPADYMFHSTFYGCSGLTSIPSDLFAGISGAPASNMFYGTFYDCSGLTGAIPDGLFGNLSGAPASSMFYSTFSGCSKLTSIPENLFGNISGTAKGVMFYRTFYNCTSLTGPSARINGQYLYEIWPDATSSQVGSMYSGATGLSDYSNIPSNWK